MSEERKVAIVTGAVRGIGKAIALQLAGDGFAVAVNYRGDQSLADEVAAMVEAVMNHWGRIDALINNAGITRDTLMLRMKEEDWDAVLDTNLKGAFLCSKAVLRPMMRQRSGTIVNLTSVIGLVGNVGQANYAAAKAGLIGLTKSMAKEVGSRGITVNAVAPGFIDTRLTDVLPEDFKKWALEMIPLNRLGEPEDVAGAVAFLVSPAARYITGNVLSVDGGMFMAT